MARKDKKLKVLVAIGLITLALWIGIGAVESFIVPYKLVGEITANPGEYLNKNVRIVGIIEVGSWQVSETAGTYEFRLTDGDGTLNVIYDGDVPGTLNPDAKVTVFGKLVSEDTVVSNKMLIKCPSKYEQKLSEASEKQTEQV
ncbi:MAG: cytochrome c maturation protein CcmE [Candidatus Hydrothermarchaeales archaeon]